VEPWVDWLVVMAELVFLRCTSAITYISVNNLYQFGRCIADMNILVWGIWFWYGSTVQL
jgi:hypothetical protein